MASCFDLAITKIQRKRRMKKRWKVIRRRRKDICCKSQQPLQEIPFDLVIEILRRLPAKSLMRFKSISKQWSSLICSKYFNGRFVSGRSPRVYIHVCPLNLKSVLLSSSSRPDSDITTMSSFVLDQDVIIPAVSGYYMSHFLRGLMCFTDGSKGKIYNTATRQMFVLPDIEESNIIVQDNQVKPMYHIGHDPIHDQYKVLCTVSRRGNKAEDGRDVKFVMEHWVLLLGGDGSNLWRKIPCRSPPHVTLTQGLTINGRMYYLAWIKVTDPPVIIIFDINSEEFGTLQVPEGVDWTMVELIDYGGRLSLFYNSYFEDEGVVKLSVLEDGEPDINRWSTKTIVLHPSQMHMVNSVNLAVRGTTSSGEVILAPYNAHSPRRSGNIINPQHTTLFYFLLYNIQKNHIRRIEIKEPSNRYITKNWDFNGFDEFENLMYL